MVHTKSSTVPVCHAASCMACLQKAGQQDRLMWVGEWLIVLNS